MLLTAAVVGNLSHQQLGITLITASDDAAAAALCFKFINHQPLHITSPPSVATTIVIANSNFYISHAILQFLILTFVIVICITLLSLITNNYHYSFILFYL